MEDGPILLHRAFIRINGKLMKILNRHLEQYDISGAEFGIIRNLGEETLTLSELSQRLLKVNSNTTAMIDSLARKGLAERIRDSDDRRVIRVRLTADGINIRNNVVPRHNQYIREVLGTLSEKEVAGLLHGLGKVEEICDRVAENIKNGLGPE